MCDMFISFDVLLCTASILNLCAISIDRYLAITRPLRYAAKRTPKRMMVMIILVWLFSALISIPPMFGFKEPFISGTCEYSSNIIYQTYATCGAFYIPLIVMLILYGRILILARNMAQADAKQQRVAESMTQFIAHSSLESEPTEQMKFEQAQILKQTTTTNTAENKSDIIINAEHNTSINSSIKEKYPLPPSELCRRRKPRPLRRLSYGEELIKKSLDIITQNVKRPQATSECSSTMSSIEQFEQHVKELKQLRAEFFAAPYTRHSITINTTQLKRHIDNKDNYGFNLISLCTTTTSNNNNDNNNNNISNNNSNLKQPVSPIMRNKPTLLTDSNRSKNSIFSPPLLSVSHYFDESSYMNSLSQISEVVPNLFTTNDIHVTNYSTANNSNFEEYGSNVMLTSQETTPLIVTSTTKIFSTIKVDTRRDFHYPPSSCITPIVGSRLSAMHPARPRQRPFHTPRRSFATVNEYMHISRPFLLDLPKYTIDRRCSSPSTSQNFSWNPLINRSITGSSWAYPKLSSVKKRNSRHHSESKAVKTLGIIMGCFCLCWLPFFIIAVSFGLLSLLF
ncbi:5-hydroxytryptamine receptor 1 [Schistosoma japonicum]|nr:5-hydroxytryptamine receptor 1 [Schistosoma japonicum]